MANQYTFAIEIKAISKSKKTVSTEIKWPCVMVNEMSKIDTVQY